MGKTITLYALQKNARHDKEKLCVGWETQPSEELKFITLSQLLQPTKNKYKPDYRFITECVNDNKFCPKCKWYFEPSHDNPFVVDYCSLQYSFSDPIIHSHWFIEELCNTNMLSKEYQHKNVYKWRSSDLQKAHRWLENIGEPVLQKDKVARQQSLELLSWVDAMLQKDLEVIYFG